MRAALFYAAPGTTVPPLAISYSVNGGIVRKLSDALSERVSLLDSAALPDIGGNQGSYFNSWLSYADTKRAGTVKVYKGNWRTTDEITISNATGISGENRVGSIVTFEGAGNYGLNINGTGFGGSPTDGVQIYNLNLWGGKTVTIARVNGTAMFRLSNIVAQNNSAGSVVRFTNSQDGALDDFDFLQCGGAGQSMYDGAVLYYGPGCNNIYTRYGRFEAPRNTAIYVDGANTVRYIGGKMDGSSGGANLTQNPFIFVKDGDLSMSSYTITGFQNYAIEISGAGQISFDGVIGNGKAAAIFKATSAAYNLFVKSGGLPGVIKKPNVKMRGRVAFSSDNTTANVIATLISLKAPDPRMMPNAGNNGRVQISGAFNVNSNLWQANIVEWNGAAWVAPVINDGFTGGWLVDSSTGNAFAQIVAQTGGLVQFRTNGLPSTGSEHFVQYDNVHGIRVDIQIDAPSNSQSRWTTKLAELKTNVTTTATSYLNGYTTVTLSAAVTDHSLTGYFLYNATADAYYYIVDNVGTQLTLMHDRTAALTNGAYDVVIGNPKAGNGITINWV